MNFILAHLSDVHLGPLPKGSTLQNFALKRVIGGLSWSLHRHKLHLPEVANAIRSDILNANPAHVAFTGDLINIAASGEFTQGTAWLEEFGTGDFISFTPGNHDAYVPVPWQKGLGHFSAHMTSDMRLDAQFPFIRLRRNVALMGVNGAAKQSLMRAGGKIGRDQRSRLSAALRDLQARGFYRVVMIHHPPGVGLAHPLRALSDAAEIQDILMKDGAELVLHGHNHMRSLTFLEGESGQIPIIGVPSASMANTSRHDIAAWNRYDISRSKGQWHTQVSIRMWNPETKSIMDGDKFVLPSRT